MSEELGAVADLAESLARQAGAIQREHYGGNFEVRTKSASVDLVTEVDHACEELIVGAITSQRPDDAIVAEEGRGEDRPDAPWRWIIDPLDGTTNFAHSYPRFCVSIGIERDGQPAVGVIYDPLLDELFRAEAGGGASLNGRPLRVSAETDIGNSLVATGFAYDIRRSVEDNINHFAKSMKRVRAIRRDGSAALDLAYVAAGRLDAYWEFKLAPWDVAAGRLIVTEAGGRVTDCAGRSEDIRGREIVASNGHLHDVILGLLQRD